MSEQAAKLRQILTTLRTLAEEVASGRTSIRVSAIADQLEALASEPSPDWPRDQISLVEWIAKKVEQPSPAVAEDEKNQDGLLPCPFCKDHVVHACHEQINATVWSNWLQCRRCKCRTDDYKSGRYLNPGEIIDACKFRWNSRSQHPQMLHGDAINRPVASPAPAAMIPVAQVEALADWLRTNGKRLTSLSSTGYSAGKRRGFHESELRVRRMLTNAQPAPPAMPVTEFEQRAAQDILALIGMQTPITTRSVASRKHLEWLCELLMRYQNAKFPATPALTAEKPVADKVREWAEYWANYDHPGMSGGDKGWRNAAQEVVRLINPAPQPNPPEPKEGGK